MAQKSYIQSVGEAEANERLCVLFGDKFKLYRSQWEKASSCELLTDFPLFLVIESRYLCNLQCIHCVHGYQDLKDKYAYQGEMSFELYKKLIDEASRYGCPSLALNNINEPLLTKDIFQRIRYAANNGFMDTMINTNALPLNEKRIEQLLDSGLTRLMVSLDAFTKETYDKIRIGSDYYQVLKNIDMFLNMRSKRRQELPLLRVTLVRLSLNEGEIAPFVEYWKGRADYVSIQEFASPEPSWNFTSLYSYTRPVFEEFSCPQPWQRVIIQGDGAVLPCCSQFAQELTLANVSSQSISEIWHSPAMERLRKVHKEGRYFENPTCKKCISTWTMRNSDDLEPNVVSQNKNSRT